MVVSEGLALADVRIRLLGGFGVVVGDRAVPADAWRGRKPAALVKLLALSPSRRLLREQVMDLLWPKLDPAGAGANLRKAVHYARRALGAEAGARLLIFSGGVLSLAGEGVSVDVDEFLELLARARRTRDESDYARAVALYGSGLLPEDRYEQWAIERGEELESEFLAALEELAGLLEARGDLEGAARAARRLIDAEPLGEDVCARLMRLYVLAGRREQALRTYEHLSARLRDQLGAEPSPETQRLYEELRARSETTPELSTELWEQVGELRVLAGDTSGATQAYRKASAHARLPDVMVRLHLKVAHSLLTQHAAEEAEPYLVEAEALGPNRHARVRLVCLRANQAWERGRLEHARRLGEQALELARADGDADDVAAAHEALAIVSHLRGEWRRGLELELERVVADGEGGAQLARICDIHQCIAQYHLYGDRPPDDVEQYGRRTLALAEQAGAVRAQAFAWCLLGECFLLRARWEEAAGCLQRSCELHESLGAPTSGLPWQRLAEVCVCRGSPGEAGPFLRRASAIATVSPMGRHLWGRIHATAALASLEHGDPVAATRSVRAAARTAALAGECPSCGALLNPIAAEAFAALGRPVEARAYADSAAAVASAFESAAWRAMAELAAGAAASVDGDAGRSRAHFQTAASLYEQAGQPYWRGRALARAAAV
jgi:DNA-binding SARP family transcriptional activator